MLDDAAWEAPDAAKRTLIEKISRPADGPREERG
jgi:hypothetical protein